MLEASPTSKPDQQKIWALRNKNVDSGFYENVITTRIIGGEAAVRGSWPWQGKDFEIFGFFLELVVQAEPYLHSGMGQVSFYQEPLKNFSGGAFFRRGLIY